MENDHDYAGLTQEPEIAASDQELLQWEQESNLADHILCASVFTRRSLVSSGISAHKISVIPYGINSEVFQFGRPSVDQPMKALYVGQKVARKGLRMLLRVWQQLQPANARLILAGGHVRDQSVLQGFEQIYTETPRIGTGDLVRLFQDADVFVLPSLAAGLRCSHHLHRKHGRGGYHSTRRKRLGSPSGRSRGTRRLSVLGFLSPAPGA
jgi:glycosyltransferase involved in cell wall biosynthesis